MRPAADLDDACTAGDAYFIEQPARFMGELFRLLLQTALVPPVGSRERIDRARSCRIPPLGSAPWTR